MTFHLDTLVQDIFDDDSWDPKLAYLQKKNEKLSMAEIQDMPAEENEEMKNALCPYNLPVYLAIGAVPLFIVGLILTGTSVFVYTRPYQLKTTVGYLLACLSIFELLFLLTTFQVFSISHIPIFSCSTEVNDYPKFKAYSSVYIYPFTHVTKYMCVCISIMISVQQWIAVFLPMKVKTLCNMRRTKYVLLFSFIFSIVISIPRFVEEKISDYGRPTVDKKWKDYYLIQFINYFDDNVFNAFIVFFVLFVINVSIICLLKWSQHERMRITSQSFQDRRTYLMLLAVLFSYVATHFPSMLIEYKDVDSLLKNNLPTEVSMVRKEISNFFMCCHPLFSFADYLIFSEKYRNTVKSIFFNKKSSLKDQPQAV